MALPKLNTSPSYTTTVPSTGEEINFRPFLVKEQKTLLIAFETQDRRDLARAVVRTIHSCVEQELPSNLPTFDVDYLFTQIRCKSVGETTDLQMYCQECNFDNEVSVNLEEIEVSQGPEETVLELTPTISVKMKYPSYEDILKDPKVLESSTETETLLKMTVLCMDAILTEEEHYSLKDESIDEAVEFLESMTAEQFDKITSFVNSIPSIHKKIEFKCQDCGHHNEITLQGMDDFF
jgi:hypothetical protein